MDTESLSDHNSECESIHRRQVDTESLRDHNRASASDSESAAGESLRPDSESPESGAAASTGNCLLLHYYYPGPLPSLALVLGLCQCVFQGRLLLHYYLGPFAAAVQFGVRVKLATGSCNLKAVSSQT